MEKEKSSVLKSQAVRTGNKDIFMSIKPEHINNIAAGTKNHEYRHYLLPSSVRRIWFYTTAPISRIDYVAHISHGKIPGEVQEDGGIGNADFNAGKKISKYGYEILDLWKLKQPISLNLAIAKGFLKGPPQKYCWVPLVLLESYSIGRQDHLISKALEERPLKTRKDCDLEEPKNALRSTGKEKIIEFFSYSGVNG
ncbi:hypothetical protein PRK78_002154 [Emydomyces testavorans]|uniref:Uncharacterized protein n=1 Tax=Emydomyces testavorans TaxID=2070801 RepID=A0AAF0DFJ9_9EURO|nr:hypothetical protein PRK78_002154 [Emydomyces testavorans]